MSMSQQKDIFLTSEGNKWFERNQHATHKITPDVLTITKYVNRKNEGKLLEIGLSDHTLGTTASIAAVSLGATVIEKHVTLNRSEGGIDAAFSLEPHELKELCNTTRDAAKAIGQVNYARSESERGNKVFRRSIYAIKDIAEGETFTADNIRIIRPGYGIAPKHYEGLLGNKAHKNYTHGESIKNN